MGAIPGVARPVGPSLARPVGPRDAPGDHLEPLCPAVFFAIIANVILGSGRVVPHGMAPNVGPSLAQPVGPSLARPVGPSLARPVGPRDALGDHLEPLCPAVFFAIIANVFPGYNGTLARADS